MKIVDNVGADIEPGSKVFWKGKKGFQIGVIQKIVIQNKNVWKKVDGVYKKTGEKLDISVSTTPSIGFGGPRRVKYFIKAG